MMKGPRYRPSDRYKHAVCLLKQPFLCPSMLSKPIDLVHQTIVLQRYFNSPIRLFINSLFVWENIGTYVGKQRPLRNQRSATPFK